MKIRTLLENLDLKNITGIEMDGVDLKDAPRYTDAYIAHAIWKDSGQPLSDAELEELNDTHQEFVHRYANEHVIDHDVHIYDQRREY